MFDQFNVWPMSLSRYSEYTDAMQERMAFVRIRRRPKSEVPSIASPVASRIASQVASPIAAPIASR